jgi:hypothetical protein
MLLRRCYRSIPFKMKCFQLAIVVASVKGLNLQSRIQVQGVKVGSPSDECEDVIALSHYKPPSYDSCIPSRVW